MSHITRIKTKIVEKQFLLKAIEDLGYQYEEGDVTISGFGANKTKADIKVKLRLSNDIGFRQTPQGYEIVADWWGVHGVNQKDFTARILQRYAYHTTRARLEFAGLFSDRGNCQRRADSPDPAPRGLRRKEWMLKRSKSQ